MQRWRGLDAVLPGWGRCVVTIGVFDGVHRGHRALLRRAVERAGELGLPCVVLTFDPHPSEVVRPGTAPATLTGPEHKAELLAALGVDVLCVLPFTVAFSRLSAEEFVRLVLVERLHAAAVVVGENFRFGHRAAGDLPALRALGELSGFEVVGVRLVGDADVTVSSTYVRSRIADGDVAAAAEVLGRPHRLAGVVVAGDRRGRELGYPTANLEPVANSAVPADGVYAGWFHRGSSRWPAAISIGTNPTFEGTHRRVEAYLLDADVNLYGDLVAIDFVARLRDTERFDTMAALLEAMRDDVARTRSVLGSAAGLAGPAGQ